MKAITFKPKQVTKTFLAVLPERAQDVVVSRFGLGKDPYKKTLESIGEAYGITRERVRQIENFALQAMRKSDAYEKETDALEELKDLLHGNFGGIGAEEDLLSHISPQKDVQNHVHLLLVIGDNFNKKRAEANFKHRWVLDEDVSQHVHRALHDLYENLSEDEIVVEDEILNRFESRLKKLSDSYKKQEILKRWLNISKVIGQNPLGEWGLASSPNIRARGARDYAYLVIRRHGSPLHFSEVAKEITKLFGRSAHIATCHNELIKDKERFVLVGRGIYGLAEWGYSSGIVRDVISDILKQEGRALHKDDLVERVLKERYVKPNTVLVNLQNRKYFKRDEEDHYTLA
ncbi:MAG: sigma factor-like helix-turn-helix DNA-binding protein [Patescibacteria group bacterium]